MILQLQELLPLDKIINGTVELTLNMEQFDGTLVFMVSLMYV